ncbi:TIGR03086 family metal-binding protein [Kitasatospora sp. GAS1066B]|uniref:TIGR03086 family metal-binding protein n=1 Tax=Kitasatospora sp. GAS1066B TaxID=3156271 RepID=UPI0035131CAE
MNLHQPLSDAVARMATVVGSVDPARLSAATPCAEYDVRGLVNHLLFWAPIIEGVGLHKTAVIDRAAEGRDDHTGGDWQADYLGWLDRIDRAWASDSAWEGTATLGPATVPAAVIGEKTLVELAVHGWDLARATGQEFQVTDAVADHANRIILATADETRAMRMFGPPVTVPATASALDRALACSGRDPQWDGPGLG